MRGFSSFKYDLSKILPIHIPNSVEIFLEYSHKAIQIRERFELFKRAIEFKSISFVMFPQQTLSIRGSYFYKGKREVDRGSATVHFLDRDKSIIGSQELNLLFNNLRSNRTGYFTRIINNPKMAINAFSFQIEPSAIF